MNTMQQEFDIVVAHLYEQGKPAMIGEVCGYRGEKGGKCAVGIRIPDSVYCEDMEEKMIGELIDAFPSELPVEIYEYAEMFGHLQSVHDKWAFEKGDSSVSWSAWLDKKLPTVAKAFNLTFTKP